MEKGLRRPLKLLMLLCIAFCGAEDCRLTEKGLDYVGRVSKTVTGRTCMRWSLKPRCYMGIVDTNLAEAENYCRNPRGFPDCQLLKPWCHTTDGHREYCDVPLCGYKEPSCAHALGMESGAIRDSQITATSWMSGHEPYRGRLNWGDEDGHAGWVSSPTGVQNKFRRSHYLTIDLLSLHDVTKITLQGSGKAADAWTRKFVVQYSTDGSSWSFYAGSGAGVKQFEGNPTRTHAISHTLDPPLRTRFIRVIPTEGHNRPALRLELFGCTVGSVTAVTRSTTPPNVLPCFPVDVAFAVDTAGKILTEYKSRLTDFFARFVTGMEISANCARMSVVTFGNAVKLQFDLHAYKDAGSLRHAVRELSMRNQSRDFARAILEVHSEVFEDTDGERNNAAKLMVLITDGNSTSYPDFVVAAAASMLAKKDGIGIQVIGIGDDVIMSQLSFMASSPANAVHLRDISDLEGDSALQQLYAYVRALTTNQSTTTPTTQPTTTDIPGQIVWDCDFEDTVSKKGHLCGMTQSSADDFDWTLLSGSTPSSDTGPDSGFGGDGHYIYIEASDPRRLNDKAMILLPSFRRDDVFCLTFSYHMYGFHVNKLRVAKLVASGQLVNLWTKTGQQGPHWQTAKFNVDLRTSDQLAFIGVRGNAFSGDIAVDSIAVKSGRCVEGG